MYALICRCIGEGRDGSADGGAHCAGL